jgi:hypothetical protein
MAVAILDHLAAVTDRKKHQKAQSLPPQAEHQSVGFQGQNSILMPPCSRLLRNKPQKPEKSLKRLRLPIGVSRSSAHDGNGFPETWYSV